MNRKQLFDTLAGLFFVTFPPFGAGYTMSISVPVGILFYLAWFYNLFSIKKRQFNENN